METEKRVIESAISHYLIKNPSDVQIAYERGFQKKAVELSKLFKEQYPNVSTMSDIEIMRIFRYFMGKAAETCIADELYQSDKERICNITYLLSDVDNEYFKINIPAHYMFELNRRPLRRAARSCVRACGPRPDGSQSARSRRWLRACRRAF